ncbi:energy transducer TonB [Erwinia sp. S43]|uniref:energy transducer TonB n=1 Tax=Erwinia sp. S43 TaxID=2769339 RepID=UPI001909B9EF|nr:energy transducer TonB [Erwinia sp. S43]MBK0032592.1 energy transducer TonB [Erwinia sp. S43]
MNGQDAVFYRPEEAIAAAIPGHRAKRWIGAGVVAVALHGGGLLWLLYQPPLAAADNAPPPAIMIELADMSEAVIVNQNEISADQKTATESQPTEKVDRTENRPVEHQRKKVAKTRPKPVEKPSETAGLVREEMVKPLESAEATQPVSHPAPPEQKREEAKTELAQAMPSQPQAASEQAVEAKAQVLQSNRDAARQSTSGLFSSSVTPATWQARLMAHLERRKRYPADARSRGETGTVYVRFSIDDAGNVLSITLARSSGHGELDDEVLSLVRRASPVPAPPSGANRTITAPVQFSVKG